MKVKEPRFLIKDLVQHRLHNGIWTFEEYQSLFADVKDQKAIGESTVLYLYYYKHAINNIKHYLGEDVKIIIMLRNPTDRAYSAFQHVSRGFKENNSFEKSLEIETGRMEREENLTPMVMYKEMGMYYEMVKAYKESFKNVHIILYEDFKDNTKSEMNNSISISRGENGFRSGGVNYHTSTGNLKHNISINQKESDGYIEGMDYKIKNYYYQAKTNIDGVNALFNAGYTNKEFGAFSFYTPKYPDQFEKTQTTFASLQLKRKGNIFPYHHIFFKTTY